MYKIPRMRHEPQALAPCTRRPEPPMGRMMKRLFLLLLLAVASVETALHVTPAWADDDGGGDSDSGDGDGGGDGDGADDGGEDGGHDAGDAEDGGSDDGKDEGDDQERARAGRASGSFLPLDAILKRVRRRHPGTVLKVRLKRRGGTAYYEIRILDRQDRVRTVTVPAGPRKRGNWASRR